MKSLILLICLFGFFQVSLEAQPKADSTAIRETVLNYIEGWDTGDSARMALSLHPQLAKRGIVPSRSGKGNDMLNASFTDMVTWTVYQKNVPKDDQKSENKITIAELGKNIASATCVSKEYIDYLHLARTEKGWKILNAIWEPNYAAMKKEK
jgi:hypothetical protein